MQITITLDREEFERLFGCACSMSEHLSYLEAIGKRRRMPQDEDLENLIQKLLTYRRK